MLKSLLLALALAALIAGPAGSAALPVAAAQAAPARTEHPQMRVHPAAAMDGSRYQPRWRYNRRRYDGRRGDDGPRRYRWRRHFDPRFQDGRRLYRDY